jgi:hypothetical protein
MSGRDPNSSRPRGETHRTSCASEVYFDGFPRIKVSGSTYPTVVDTSRGGDGVPHPIRAVIDMRDDPSAFSNRRLGDRNAHPAREEESAICRS